METLVIIQHQLSLQCHQLLLGWLHRWIMIIILHMPLQSHVSHCDISIMCVIN